MAGRLGPVDAAPRRDAFIEGLIQRMTLEEKAGQLSIYFDDAREEAPNVNPAQVAKAFDSVQNDILQGRIGGLFNGLGVASGRRLQRLAVEQSRLKIPLIFAADVIHGLRTVFPVPLAEAAAFDPDLAERTARAAALEATAVGIQWTFGPVVDIARDQRWGRVVEGAGEDPYLGRLLATARVRGFQGRSLKDADSMLATLKHFAAYGAVGGGMDYNSADIPPATLHDVHLPPFRAGIEAGALSVMTAYNDVAGIPATGHRGLLTGVLREQWGFRGLVVSDFASDAEMVNHGYAADEKDAARKALLAGCDVSMASGAYSKHLPALVREGAVPLAALDEAVRRVLGVKQALGLFDNPYRSLDLEKERMQIRLPQTVAVAREAARRAVVLLKNDGGLLPLQRAGTRIALIGPFGADRAHVMGPWALWADGQHAVSLEQGLREAMPDPALLEVVAGCGIEEALPGGLAAATAAAQRADVVLLAVGEGDHMAGEMASRVDIGLPPAQRALAEAVAATGKPIVVLLRHGRALDLPPAVRDARAIMATWFLGSETGHAIADLVFGDHSPSGRLPVSFPLASGQQPYFYNHRRTGRPQTSPQESAFKARYREVEHRALYPFGHGLGYGDVVYGPTQASSEAMGWNATLTLRATLANRGARAMREVAQLYIHQRVAAIARPVRELRGFKAVELQPGETATVEFRIRRSDLAYVGAEGKAVTEPGWFDVVIAPSAVGGVSVALRLLAN
jgi:beta-glucosidase